jgi:carbonic anhydrase
MERVLFRLAVVLAVALTAAGQQPATAPSSHASHHAAKPTSASADQIWAELMEGNQRFVAGKPKTRELIQRRASLVKGQQPRVVVLSCSDSRVAPELLFDQNLGDLFVVRSAGNIADAIGIGSIEYAVEHLGSSLLVVLGHTQCGAVKAACSGEKMPTSNLQAIVEKINPAVLEAEKSASGTPTGDTLVEAAVRNNVHESAKSLLLHSEVLRHSVAEGKLKIVEAEYQLETGKVIRLDTHTP